MSLLIEMPEFQVEPVQQDSFQILLHQVASLLHHPEFNVAVVMTQQPSSITIALPKGQLAFVRDTRWNLEIVNNKLKIQIHFYDYSGLNHLRAQSQRMKLELIILLRSINNKVPIEQEFFVQPQNGALRYTFLITWKEYREKLKGQNPLRKLFRYILAQLIQYAEIILFCEPQAQEVQAGQPFYSAPHDLQTINRYKFILTNSKKFRENNLSVLEQVCELKKQLRQNPNNINSKIELDQLRVLFQSNIAAYEQMRVGLEDDPDKPIPFQKQLEKCMRHVYKNAQGKESRPPQTNIVSGIQIIQKVEAKSISTQGAHSQILRGKFIFRIIKTINLAIISNNKTLWTDGKQNKAELIFKTCNLQQPTSINAFMNQLYFLNHIRDCQSSYIAKYYLQIKDFQQRSEKDYIFMRPYFHNLYLIVKKCKTLSIEERLSISYKISKGLCFLSSKGVLHRDFKPHNIMVDQLFNPFIIDFGSCAPIYRQSNFKVRQDRLLTTPHFHIYYHEIPQQYSYIRSKFTREQYNRHPLFDVYSLGRVLSFLYFGSLTPPNFQEVANQPYPQLLTNIVFVIELCLQVDPDQRPTLSQIASFLGTLKGYLSAITLNLYQKVRARSQHKPSSNNLQK